MLAPSKTGIVLFAIFIDPVINYLNKRKKECEHC